MNVSSQKTPNITSILQPKDRLLFEGDSLSDGLHNNYARLIAGAVLTSLGLWTAQ